MIFLKIHPACISGPIKALKEPIHSVIYNLKLLNEKDLMTRKIIKPWYSRMDENNTVIMVYITASTEEEASVIGDKLLEDHLIACANIIPGMKSIYRWEGKIVHDSEAVLILKTRKSNLDEIISRVREMHSYTCPCILSYPSCGGHEDYIRWIMEETER